MKEKINHIIHLLVLQPKDIAPLLTFRILFGALMFVGTVRFMYNGWIEKLYLEPSFFFKFYGFSWVEVLGEAGMYALFFIAALSALGIMLGFFYRWASILFFLSFTYIELIDATNYLNHYYLVCLLAFIMIFLPANRAFSLDVWRKPNLAIQKIPAWTIHIIIFQLGIVYTFAGLAKLNPDWLFSAMPLAIWLPEHQDIPILGYFFQFKWCAFLFSWVGAFYDLTITWFLLFRRTQKWAYLTVVVFHLMTYLLFNIGLFPFIMIFSTLIFLKEGFHLQLLSFLGYRSEQTQANSFIFSNNGKLTSIFCVIPSKLQNQLLHSGLIAFIVLQLILPNRHLFYPGDALWTEEGYRFSWRVMLVEKIGHTTFYIKDKDSNRKSEIINGKYLTRFQEKQMNIQPDFILQFAHFLKEEYRQKHGIQNPIITVDAHVAINGRTSKLLIDPQINLAEEQTNLLPKNWILAYQ